MRQSRFLAVSVFVIGVGFLCSTVLWHLVGGRFLSLVTDSGYPDVSLEAVAPDVVHIDDTLQISYVVRNQGDVPSFSTYLLIHTPLNAAFDHLASDPLCQSMGTSVVCSSAFDASRGFVLEPGESRHFIVAFRVSPAYCDSAFEVDASALVVSPMVVNGFGNHAVTSIGVSCALPPPPALESCSMQQHNFCGDGCVGVREQCDDGNTINFDGCTHCQVDPGSHCGGNPSACTHEVIPSPLTQGFEQYPSGFYGYGKLPEHSIVLDDEQATHTNPNRKKLSGGYANYYSKLRGSPGQPVLDNSSNWDPVMLRGDYDVYVTWNPEELSISPVMLRLRMTALDADGAEIGEYVDSTFTEQQNVVPNGPSWGGQLWERVGTFHVDRTQNVRASIEFVGGRAWKNWWYSIDAIALVHPDFE